MKAIYRISPISSSTRFACPFVAPDESYLIFESYGGSIGFADLFISFKNNEGNWQEAIIMGADINTGSNETCPNVSPDGQYLFFLRNNKEGYLMIFRVDAVVISYISLTIFICCPNCLRY